MPPVSVTSPDVVHGFANQVPLSVALREILPPGYGFSLDADVDVGTLVSFHGGKPWRETLKGALDPVGLGMHEQGQMIVVEHGPSAQQRTRSVSVAPSPSSGPAGHAPMMGSPPQNLETIPEMVSAPPVPPSGSAGGVLETWNAERGDTLHKILGKWAHRANAEFDWMAEYDYPLQASVSFTGTFEEAVRNLLTGFETAHPQPIAELHANPNLGQMVLLVTTRGNNYSD
jgi:hypothetical protein